MNDMLRENRYLVLKRKELDLLSDEAKKELENIVFALGIAKSKGFDAPTAGEINCVVVEHDWPMYETVWRMIEDWIENRADNTKTIQMYDNDEEIKLYPSWVRKLIWTGTFIVGALAWSAIYLAIKVSL